MKIENYLGDNMPKMPWMINYDVPVEDTLNNKKECIRQSTAANASNYMNFAAKLNVNTKTNDYMLSTITCTLGPKNYSPDFLEDLLKQGIRSICIDLSSGSSNDHVNMIDAIRSLVLSFSENIGREYPFMIGIEITGLRIRTGLLDSYDSNKITLEEGQMVYLTTDQNYNCHCNKHMIYVNYPDLLKVLSAGNYIFIDYGNIILEVFEIGKKYKTVNCKILNGGKLRDSAIINMPNVPQTIETVLRTELFTFALKNKVDAIIISRPKGAYILENARQVLGPEGNEIMLIAKIEDASAYNNIDEIINYADAIIVSRDELGMEMPPNKLFILQKSIIAKCNLAGKPVLCGTHLLQSMRKSRLPTRAEMLDVSNSILDGADGFILSDDITYSPYFLECIQMLQNISIEAEAAVYQKELLPSLFTQLPINSEPTYACAITAVESANKCNAACIIVLTVSGRSAKLIARYRPLCPIIAITRYGHVARKLNMWRGVIPMHYIAKPRSEWLKEIDTRLEFGITFGKCSGLIKAGDAIVLVSGFKELSGFTNTVRIVYASQKNMLI